MIHQIRVFPDPILLERVKPVELHEFNSPKLHELISDMWDTTRAVRGLGLAANQIGVAKALAVLRDRDTGAEHVMINPYVTAKSGTLLMSEQEGCLSLPTLNFNVMRFEKLTVAYFDAYGRPHSISGEGYMAVELQHEIGHLQGVTLLSGAGSAARAMAMNQLKKWRKKNPMYPVVPNPDRDNQ